MVPGQEYLPMCRHLLQLLQVHTWLGELGYVVFPVLGVRGQWEEQTLSLSLLQINDLKILHSNFQYIIKIAGSLFLQFTASMLLNVIVYLSFW